MHKKRIRNGKKKDEDARSDASSVDSEEFHEMLDSLLSDKEECLDFAEGLGSSTSKQNEGLFKHLLNIFDVTFVDFMALNMYC